MYEFEREFQAVFRLSFVVGMGGQIANFPVKEEALRPDERPFAQHPNGYAGLLNVGPL